MLIKTLSFSRPKMHGVGKIEISTAMVTLYGKLMDISIAMYTWLIINHYISTFQEGKGNFFTLRVKL